MALTHGFFFRNIFNIFFLYFLIFNYMNKVFNTFTESKKDFLNISYLTVDLDVNKLLWVI